MDFILFYPQTFGRIICILFFFLALFYVSPIRRRGKLFSNIVYYLIAGLAFHLGYLFDFAVNHEVGRFGLLLPAIAPIGFLFMLRFAYDFPMPNFEKEKKIVTILYSVLSVAAITEFFAGAAQAPVDLLATGYVTEYTSKSIPAVSLLIHLTTLSVFYRQSRFIKANFDFKVRYGGPLGFACLVLLELATAVALFIYLYVKHRSDFFILSVLNIFFFLIIVAYCIILLKYSRRYISMTFKLVGLTITITLLCFNVFGFFYMNSKLTAYNDKAYDAFTYFIKSGLRTNELKPLYVFDVAGNSYHWQLNKSHDPAKAIDKYLGYGKHRDRDEHIMTSGSYNYVQYQYQYENKWYLVGYSEQKYRQMTHDATMRLIYLLLGFGVVLALLFPLLVNRGILHPVRNLIDTMQSIIRTDQRADLRRHQSDLALLSDSMHILDQAMRDHQVLQSRYIELEEKVSAGQKRNSEQRAEVYDSPEIIEKVEIVKTFIEENFNYDISREGLASSVNMSVSTLGKAFKHLTSKTIRDYLNELRIEKSAKVLVETDTPITDIAYRVGFDSLRTFNRAFRKTMGCTPSEYKSKNRVGVS